MPAATTAPPNRGTLLRAARQGRLWMRCLQQLTDDYAFDNATGFGRETDFRRVYVAAPFSHPLEDEIEAAYDRGASHAEVEPLMVRLRDLQRAHRDADRDRASGGLLLDEHDFRTKSGYCSYNTLAVHSNRVYEYELR